jgi:fluoroacetyl-CoA thioesterase
MKMIFKPGDKKVFSRKVDQGDQAIFHGELLHPVCSTFALARDFEWSSRLFFLEMKEADEEGVGTFLTIDHKGPAFVGEEIIFTASVERIEGLELICNIEARAMPDSRLIAVGKTGQKMLKKEKLAQLFSPPLDKSSR